MLGSYTTLVVCTALIATPAAAIDGEILINQAKAIQGGITPGDVPGFPITLTRPGTYKFASNITPPPSTIFDTRRTATASLIEVKEPDVTIDLNGFRLHGQGRVEYGISVPTHVSLTVRNGTIAGFQDTGIDFRGGHLELSRICGLPTTVMASAVASRFGL